MIEDLGNLGDFIGGIAVVLTLIYLARQVRQNTAALQTASRQEIVDGMRENVQLWLQPGMAEALTIGMRSWPDMPFDQRMKYGNHATDLALFFQGVFALHESGVLEDETYRAYLDFFCGWLSTPGGRAVWADLSGIFTPRMVEAVDARLEQGGLPNLTELPLFRWPETAGVEPAVG